MKLFLIFGVLAASMVARAETYRVNCREAQWRSVDAINKIGLKPGDTLLLQSGCRWEGTLHPTGSGTKENPIVLDRQGTGPLPVIDGHGTVAAFLLHNQEFWDVRHLELTNDAAEPGLRHGILIEGENLGRALEHIHLEELDVHHVRGKLGADMASKLTGGIGLEITDRERPTRFNDVAVVHCRIHTVDNTGIYLNNDRGPHPRDPDWQALKNTNVVIRSNTLEDIGKNAIGVRASQAPLIEDNILRHAAARFHGNAIYVFGCKDARIRFNEVSGTEYRGLEGAAYDSDYNCEGTTIEYNYAFENGGGLVDICNNARSMAPRGYNDGTVIRYNVSRGDTSRVIGFDGPATNTQIYNNTLYIARGLQPHIVEFDLFGKAPGYADRTTIRNNIIVNAGNGVYLPGGATNTVFDSNCFAGNVAQGQPADAHALMDDPKFRVGDKSDFALQDDSPCIGNGAVIEKNGGRDYAGVDVPQGRPVDRGAFQHAPLTVTEGLVWRTTDALKLRADLYRPQGKGPFPAALYLHGGGWSGGDRRQLRRMATAFAEHGVAGMAIDYRLSPAYRYPAATDDARAAIEWMQAHAAELNFDRHRLVLVGSSAGGELAALLGVTSGAAQAVIVFNPVLDVTEMDHRRQMIRSYLGGSCEANRKTCVEASPLLRIHKRPPPFLILHGTADETVPYQQAEQMRARLSKAGGRVELFTAEGAGHAFWATQQWFLPARKAAEAFLLQVLQKTQ